MIQTFTGRRDIRKVKQSMSDGSTSDGNESNDSTMASSLYLEPHDTVPCEEQRFPAQESTTATSVDMYRDRLKTIEELQVHMTGSLSSEFAGVVRQSSGDWKHLGQSIPFHANDLESSRLKKQQEHEAKLKKIAAEHDETKRLHRGAEKEANALQIKLASTQDRAKMLQARLDECQKERSDTDQDRRSMREQMEELWQRVIAAEGELCQHKTESVSLAAEVERLTAARRESKEAEKAAKSERDAAQAKEDEFRRKQSDLLQQFADAKRERDISALKLEAEKRETIARLERQIERMITKANARKEEIMQLEHSKAMGQRQLEQVQKEKDDGLRVLTDKIAKVQKDLKACEARKADLRRIIEDLRNACRAHGHAYQLADGA
eukprot:TRINITY_DN10103_c1_g1_i1.p1 TRINITY_DN10103_c1_g1~~TRINITY_DN10103_c1_g1_i1.p1  ORF type:complete len:379 (+),score=89.35 TRINITY_DN10103_c1_g1_i1:152-1288(+)